MQRTDRPLSPHLQVYRLQITSALSISHRITGFILSAGLFILVAVLYALAFDPELFRWSTGLAKTTLGQVALYLWAFCLYYHLCNGIRHLFWDIGKGFELKSVTLSGYLVIVSALTLTALTWFLGQQPL